MDRFLLELNAGTKNRLDGLRSYPEEPYDLVLNRIIDAFEDGNRLTREEVREIREALRSIREGRFSPRAPADEEVPPAQETPPPSAGDPQAVTDMERIFSGAAEKIRDPELTEPDSGDIHEIDPYDRRGRSRTPHLDSL